MDAEEIEYMNYLIHNRNELTDQIAKHLDEIELLQKKLDIAINGLTRVVQKVIPLNDFGFRGSILRHLAQEALKEIDLVGTSTKEVDDGENVADPP